MVTTYNDTPKGREKNNDPDYIGEDLIVLSEKAEEFRAILEKRHPSHFQPGFLEAQNNKNSEILLFKEYRKILGGLTDDENDSLPISSVTQKYQPSNRPETPLYIRRVG